MIVYRINDIVPFGAAKQFSRASDTQEKQINFFAIHWTSSYAWNQICKEVLLVYYVLMQIQYNVVSHTIKVVPCVYIGRGVHRSWTMRGSSDLLLLFVYVICVLYPRKCCILPSTDTRWIESGSIFYHWTLRTSSLSRSYCTCHPPCKMVGLPTKSKLFLMISV